MPKRNPNKFKTTKNISQTMSSNSPQIIKINELDLEMIQPSTSSYMNPSQGGHKIVVIGKPGCFSAGTKVLMYDGTTKSVEKVHIGDQVMGPDSKPRNVLELCRNSDEMFQIISDNDESYIVNKKHKLVLTYDSATIEIPVDEYLDKSSEWKEKWKLFRTGVEFKKTRVTMKPYTFGLWVSNTTSDLHRFAYSDPDVWESLYEYYKFMCGTKSKTPDYTFNNFRLISNQLKPFERYYLPNKYKINDRDTRMEVLAGIIDINGTYIQSVNTYIIMNKNRRYVDDIIFLARSLGFRAYLMDLKKSNFGNRHYKVIIEGNIHDIPCRVKRKRIISKDNKCNLSYNFTVQPKGVGDYYGFTIDGDHRFLLGSFDVVRNTGKTTLISSLLYAKKHIIPVFSVYSGTEDSNGFYRKILPSTFIFNKYKPEQIKKFISRQKISKQHLTHPWAVLLLDDCTDEPALFRKPLQQSLYKAGRHWKMLYILSLQYCMDVRPVIRTNVDGCFILRETNLKNRKSLYENYAGVIPDFHLFCTILDQITDDYTALYIHNATQVNDWKSCVFWYKAIKVPEKFKLGCDDFWDFHFQRFDPNYVDPLY